MEHNQVIEDLGAIVGAKHVLTSAEAAMRYDGYPPLSPVECLCIVRPGSTSQVSAVLRYANDQRLRVVPQGGRTGLVGGARSKRSDIALSLERMTAISTIDPLDSVVVVEAGAPLQKVQEAAEAAGLYYPVDLGARGSATIGGNIATNAGGNSVFRYGMTRDQVLGMEVVLADGTVISSMNQLIKNNSGYDIKQLFIGSEGTLGIITRAVLRLRTRSQGRATALVALHSFEAVLRLLRNAEAESDDALTSFEVMWPSFVRCVSAAGAGPFPISTEHPIYVLLELSAGSAEMMLEEIIERAWNTDLVIDAVIAKSLSQAKVLWDYRDDIDAVERLIKPSIYYDISLPQNEMATYVENLEEALQRIIPGAQLLVFGHIADGNLHICIGGGSGREHGEIDKIVYEPLAAIGGSISAEHGIGVEKKEYLHLSRSPEEVDLMKKIKGLLDPCGTLNPGKILNRAGFAVG